MKALHIYFILIILCSSCAPRIATRLIEHREPLGFKEEVVILEKDDTIPSEAIKIGQVRIGDNGFSKSNNYADVIACAVEEARKSGGNLLQVIKHKSPDLWSTTHRITAVIYKIKNTSNLKAAPEKTIFLSDNVAIIHIYRANAIGSALAYNVFLGEQLLCRVNNNWKMSVQISQEGLNKLWAKTESKTEIPIKIELGKEYYLRCSVTTGFFTGHPKLELLDAKTGKLEFDAIKCSDDL